MELTHAEKQLILYTKGHFKRINYMEDLKYFAAHQYNIYPEQVDKRSIMHMVIILYEKLSKGSYINFDLETFINDLFRRAWFKNEDHISWETIIQEMLARIQGILAKGLDLGKADFSILK